MQMLRMQRVQPLTTVSDFWMELFGQFHNQMRIRVVYNGHKRVHALKFQSVALPNGIIRNMYGPVGSTTFYFFGFNEEGAAVNEFH